jgi:hypothetical protein
LLLLAALPFLNKRLLKKNPQIPLKIFPVATQAIAAASDLG